MITVKTRFSPSPTGQMHLGSVRTALFNFLLAGHEKGAFLLRIEDTDKIRSTSEYADLLKKDLQWLDLHWQEGPFFQSERQMIYDEYYAYLEKSNAVYPCFCHESALALSRKIQLSLKKPPRYAGTCANLTSEEIEAKKKQGILPALRFRVPQDKEIYFEDLIKGPQRFHSDDIGDFIIRRSDKTASFFFCNAIDDALMGITYAIRGEDHLTNTPRQILILDALNLTIPRYGHTALILDAQGNKLSKRERSASLNDLREQGYLPIAIHNYLARLGHYYTQTHLMSLQELSAHFSLQHMSKTSAHFDGGQLLHWQKLAVMHLSQQDFWDWINTDHQTAIHDIIPDHKQILFSQLIQPNIVFPQEAAVWANIFYGKNRDLDSDINTNTNIEAKNILNKAGENFLPVLTELIQENGENYSDIIKQLSEKTGLKNKDLFQPLRIALTGQLHGPELAGIFTLLGKEKLLEKIKNLKIRSFVDTK